ncbi:MAG: MFS transporter, partial [Chloroflexota bacterium]
QSLFPMLVKREHLMHAVAIYSGVWSGSQIVAPAIAGWVIGLVGTEGCFFLTGALQVTAVGLFFQVKRHADTRPGKRRQEGAVEAFTSGIRYVRRDPIIAALVLTAMGTTFLGYPSATALLPSYAANVLRGDATVFGSLLTAMGVGALAVNLILAAGMRVAGRGKVMLGLGALWGVLLLALGQTTDHQVALLLMGLIGACSAGAMTLATTLTQMSVSDDMRGRVMSVFILTWGLASVGGLAAGALGSAIGVPNAITVGGLGTLVVVALACVRSPSLLRLD